MNCLDKSIEHWERVLQYVKAADLPSLKKEGWSGNQCACCIEFIDNSEDDDCLGCPVREYTGQPDCLNTPWWYANTALYEFIDNVNLEVIKPVTDELDFLKLVRKYRSNYFIT